MLLDSLSNFVENWRRDTSRQKTVVRFEDIQTCLAGVGVKIEKCRDCGLKNPYEGADNYYEHRERRRRSGA